MCTGESNTMSMIYVSSGYHDKVREVIERRKNFVWMERVRRKNDRVNAKWEAKYNTKTTDTFKRSTSFLRTPIYMAICANKNDQNLIYS